MTPDDVFVKDLERFLERRAGTAHAAYLAETLEGTAGVPQRPWWSSPERWLPMDIPASRPLPIRVDRRVLVAFALVAALVATLVAVTAGRRPLPAPFGPAANGTLLFVHDWDIYRADVDGSPTPLIADPLADLSVTIARDGTRFAFLRTEGELEGRPYVASMDGSGLRPVTAERQSGDVQWLDWSPDGRSLGMLHEVDGSWRLEVVDVASGGLRIVPTRDVQVLGWASWLASVDRPSIAFRGRASEGEALFRVGLDGEPPERLTPLATDMAYMDPSVSPDGLRLTYWNWEARSATSFDPDGFPYLLDLRTLVATRIVDSAFHGDDAAIRGTFSPDGRRIAVTKVHQQPIQIWVLTLDGAEPALAIPIRFRDDVEYRYAFSPDGRQLVVTVQGVGTQTYDTADGHLVHTYADDTYAMDSWQRLAMP